MKKTWAIWIVIGILTTAAIAAVAGCDIGEIVQTSTPNMIQQQTGLPARMSLNDAEAEYQVWFATVQEAGTRWKASIEKGNQTAALLSQLFMGTLDELGPLVAGVPILGPALPAGGLLLGLFFGRRGMAKEKEASFNEGIKRASEVVNGK